MADSLPFQEDHHEETENKAEQIAAYLRREPHNLVDTKRVMHRFRASAADFQRAFVLLEQPARN